MNAENQIKSDLINYAQLTNKSVDVVINELISTAPQSMLMKAKSLPKAIVAWKILQLQNNTHLDYYADKSNSYIYNTDTVVSFKTKRFLFDIIKSNVLSKKGCFAIVGPRKIGKTILLKQLYNLNVIDSVYLDCSIEYPNDFNRYYNDLISLNKRFVFIDEVCKIKEGHREFVSATKNASGSLCIIISGSTSFVVEDICYDIGRGEVYTLPPFMYIELLSWKNNVDLCNVKPFVTNDTFIHYIKNQFMSNSELVAYMRGVVHDTIDSYRDHTDFEGPLALTDNDIDKSLIYISVCQLVYRRGSDNNFINMPHIPAAVRDCLVNKNVKPLKNHLGLSNKTIKLVLRLLCSCGLAKRVRIIKELYNSAIDAYLFEYPWYTSYCLNPKIQNADDFIALWIEYYILIKAYYIYTDVAKYRNDDQAEIDVLYTIDGWLGIEVKNRPAQNISQTYKSKLNKLQSLCGITDLFITDNSCNAELTAAMEFEYISLLKDGLVNSTKTVRELLDDFRQ